MATILLTWELGGGMGHVLPLRAIGEELTRRGHRVIAALRDLTRVGELFAGSGIGFIPAPVISGPRDAMIKKISGFTHILANIGFAHEANLAAMFASWNTLYDCIRPDLVVADHSPTALLALRGRPIPCVNMGLAFCCPPDAFPLPYWWSRDQAPPLSQLIDDEQRLVASVNRLLASEGRPTLQRLSHLFNQINDVVLATFRELDPYGERKAGRYWGHCHVGTGIEPVWPDGDGPKLYVYLKVFPALEEMLQALGQSDLSTIVLSAEIPKPLQDRYASPRLCFESRPLHMAHAAAKCDLAILNAGHGTTASMLLAGKPMLLMPLYIEQLLNAQAAERVGAARWVLASSRGRLSPLLHHMLGESKYRAAAQAFASRYAGFVPGQQIPAIADHLESLIGKAPVYS